MLWLVAYLTGFPPAGLYALNWAHGQTPIFSCLPGYHQKPEKPCQGIPSSSCGEDLAGYCFQQQVYLSLSHLSGVRSPDRI